MFNYDLSTVSMISGRQATSTVTPSTGVDMRDFTGEVTFILDSGAASAGTDPTLDVKLQESTASDGSGDAFADISGATFTQVTDAAASHQAIKLNIDNQPRYIRAVATIGGTDTPTFAFSVVAVGEKKYQS